LRVAGPFGCRCPNVPPCSVSTPRSSNRTGAFNASGSPTGIFSRPTVSSVEEAFTGVNSSFRDRRAFDEVTRPCGQSPGSWSLPQRTRSEVPSLRRHYPVSPVLWTSPTPRAARPVPRGLPVGLRTHRLGSPVLRTISVCRHAVAITPVRSWVRVVRSTLAPRRRPSPSPCWVGSHVRFFEACSAFTHVTACLLAGPPVRPFPSEASAVSLPPLPLRLLPAGARVAGWEFHPLKIAALARRTRGRIYFITNWIFVIK